MTRVLAVLLLTVPAIVAEQAPPEGATPSTAQAKRGEEIFFHSQRGAPCGTCHQLRGRGTAVAPDLTKWARMSPNAILTAVKATLTAYVVEVTVKPKRAFPALKKGESGETAEYFDLSVMPPVLVKLDKAEIVSTRNNESWKHPPESTAYNNQELADIIAYLRWATYGDTKGVKAEEIVR